MAKLYPPYIEGTIPAFYTETKNGTDQTILTVPFSMNRSVGKSDIKGFALKMKTVNSNVFIYSDLTVSTQDYDINNEYVVEFDLGAASKLKVGTFYKVQLAYVSKSNEVGYYSTVGIVKYTTKPIVRIDNLSDREPNTTHMTYYGFYSQTSQDVARDATEKVYSYQFVITDKEENIIADSGVQIHNNENNTLTYESMDEWTFPDTLTKNETYYIQYIVTTVNKAVVKSQKYKIVNKMSIKPELKAQLNAVLNYDNGYIEINLIGTLSAEGEESAATGAFLITRSSSDSNFTVWHDIMRFQLHGQLPSRKLLTDFTIEQGKEYQYALQQYSDEGLYSEKMLSNIIMSDFEDAFLYDGVRQLKIKYNPKVSSFKIDRPESKVETIGSKYPFFFRNGNVEYREFSIGGLISYLSDEEELFMTNEELNLTDNDELKRVGTIVDADQFLSEDIYNITGAYIDYDYLKQMAENRKKTVEAIENAHIRTTDFLDYSIAAERMFKMAALEWLTNGEPKLFRSPGEGNYMVRLMNVSLSPEDKTSRILHSFTATAYEVAPCDYQTLIDYEIIDTTEENIVQLRWETVPLSTTTFLDDSRYTQVGDIYYARGALLANNRTARTVSFTDMQPGSMVYILTADNFRSNVVKDEITGQYKIKNETNGPGCFQIGATGSYILDVGTDIRYIGVPEDATYTGLVTYSYYNDAQNVFNAITNVNPVDYLGQQYIGAHSNILNTILNIKNLSCTFLYLHFAKRSVGEAYFYDNAWYRDSAYTMTITEDPSPTYVQETGYYADPMMLYKYEVDSFDAYVTGRSTPVKLFGITQVTNEEVRNSLVNGDEVYEGYYFFRNDILVNAKSTVYDNKRTYYIKTPFVFYYDPFHPVSPSDEPDAREEHLIMDPASYEVAIKYVKDVIGSTRDDIKIEGIDLYSNVITINGYQMDLTDTEKYDIDFRYDFSNIELTNGVVLECGYEVQEVTYIVESLRQVTSDALRIGTNYRYYQDIISSEAYSKFLNERTDDNDDLEYAEKLADSRKNYPAIYDDYIRLVEQQEALWEEAYNYESATG